MRWEIDEFASLKSPLHQWEPRCKLIGLLAIAFAFATIKNLSLVPGMLTVTLLLYVASRLPIAFWTSRIRYPGGMLLAIVLLLPLISGQTILWQWGGLSLRQEGVMAMLLIVGRFLSIVTISLIWLGTAPFLVTVRSMRAIGLPLILTDLLLLSYRYVFELSASLTQMQQAMRLRGFSLKRPRRDWPRIAALIGTLLIRSYEQADRVYQAMRLRGYGQPVRLALPAIDRASRLKLVAALLIAIGFVVADALR